MDEEGEGPLARWSRLKRRSGSARSGRRGGAAPVTVANVDPGFPADSAPTDTVPAVAPGVISIHPLPTGSVSVVGATSINVIIVVS